MTTNRKQIRHYADEIAAHLSAIADEQVSIKSLVDAAKDEGINTKALLKVAKELAMESEKVARILAESEQLDLFRVQVDLRRRKGLDHDAMDTAE